MIRDLHKKIYGHIESILDMYLPKLEFEGGDWDTPAGKKLDEIHDLIIQGEKLDFIIKEYNFLNIDEVSKIIIKIKKLDNVLSVNRLFIKALSLFKL